MTNQEILEKAIKKVEAQTGQVYAHTMFELFDDLTILQDFAKALWGSFNDDLSPGMPRLTFQQPTRLPDKWQYHLQQMVIAEDPIKYLGENCG